MNATFARGFGSELTSYPYADETRILTCVLFSFLLQVHKPRLLEVPW